MQQQQSIMLDHCWVCGEKFQRVGGTAVEHSHHMVPRAYGGVDGPQVSLCDGHHNTLHQLAVAWKSKKPHFHLTQGLPKEWLAKIEYLAGVVCNAELQSRNDPNKSAAVMLHLNHRQKVMVDRLKKVYPAAGSRPAIMALALEALYKRHFID